MRKMIFAMALWLAALSLLPGDAAALERDTDRSGGDYKASYVDDASACERECRRNGDAGLGHTLSAITTAC
jgi:hypothetical protein